MSSVFSPYRKNGPLGGSKSQSRKVRHAYNTEVVPFGNGLVHREWAQTLGTAAEQKAIADRQRLRNKKRK